MGKITVGKARKNEAHKDYWVVRDGGKALKRGFHLSKTEAKRQAETIRRVRISRKKRMSK